MSAAELTSMIRVTWYDDLSRERGRESKKFQLVPEFPMHTAGVAAAGGMALTCLFKLRPNEKRKTRSGGWFDAFLRGAKDKT